MKFFIGLLLTLLGLSACAFVPGSKNMDSLLNKTYAQRYMHLWAHHNVLYQSHDSALAHLAQLTSFAEKHKDHELKLEVELLRVYYNTHYYAGNHAYCIATFDTLRSKLRKEKNISLEARLESIEANYYWEQQNYARAFEHTLKEYNLVQNLEAEEYPEKLWCLLHIVDYYYLFRDYENAIVYLKKVLNIKQAPADRSEFTSAANTIGLCYQKMGKRDSALFYFRKAYDLATQDGEAQWQGITNGNMGAIFFELGEYDRAIPLLQSDIDLSVERKDWCCASGAQMLMAAISIKRNNPGKAAEQLKLAEEWALTCGQYDRKATLYPLFSKLYSMQGKSALAVAYLDSALFVKDSLTRKYNILQLARVKEEADLRHYNDELTRIETEKRVKTLQRNALMAVMVVLLVLAIYIYIMLRKRHEQQQQLAELELKGKQLELESARGQLDEFARSIFDKSRLIADLQDQMNETVDAEIIAELQQKTILTDDEWEHFRELFEKVHAGFLQRMRQKLQGLTPAEERFVVLAKLRFNIKEMAAALGVSQQAVRNTWYRLRKKLNLPEEGSVEELVEQI